MQKIKVYFSLIFLFVLCGFSGLTAQEASDAPKHSYSNAIGIRAGGTSGISFKHFLNSGNAVEFLAGFWQNAIGLTGLYEKHNGLLIDGLKFYYGGGAHVTAETGRNYYQRHGQGSSDYHERYGENGFAVGIDGVAGLEYKIGAIPLAISFDIKPFVEVSNYGVIYTAFDAGLGLKLAF